jgi:hypothetical protein
MMQDYYSVRVWQLKPGASTTELEALTASGILEMQRWIPGVKHLSLIRLTGESVIGRYLLITTFTNYEAYKHWRQVEEEGPDYWERYASVLMHWEQLSALIEEYVGEAVVDTNVEEGYK